jgi:hypothetical protein
MGVDPFGVFEPAAEALFSRSGSGVRGRGVDARDVLEPAVRLSVRGGLRAGVGPEAADAASASAIQQTTVSAMCLTRHLRGAMIASVSAICARQNCRYRRNLPTEMS